MNKIEQKKHAVNFNQLSLKYNADVHGSFVFLSN